VRACLSICLLLALGAPGTELPKTQAAGSPEQNLLTLLNQERQSQKLPALALDEQLAAAARQHSQAMAQAHKLGHTMPGEPVLNQRLALSGAHFDSTGENVAQSDTVENAHIEFMHSQGHRANILSADFNVVGIGTASAGTVLYVTEDFVHRVPDYTPETLEATLLSEMNRLRAQKRIPPLQSVSISMLRHEACREEVHAHSLGNNFAGAGWVVVFTGADAADLPAELRKVALNREAASVALGSCFPPAVPGNYALYRVVAIFFHKS